MTHNGWGIDLPPLVIGRAPPRTPAAELAEARASLAYAEQARPGIERQCDALDLQHGPGFSDARRRLARLRVSSARAWVEQAEARCAAEGPQP